MGKHGLHKSPRRLLFVWLLPTILTALGLAAGTAFGGVTTATKGPIPIEAVQPGGHVLEELVPAFIPALDRQGNEVGYVSKTLALDLAAPEFDAHGRPEAPVIPVYSQDLQTVVGFMYPGRGFVALGVSPESVPTFEVRSAPAP